MKNLPKILTLLRIFLSFVFIYFFLSEGICNLFFAVLVFSFAAITDFGDGFFARRFNVCSDLGCFLDPLADKILTNSVFVCLFIRGLIGYWVLFIFIIRDIIISVFRIIRWEKNIVVFASNIGKLKTVLQFILIYLFFIKIYMNFNNFDFVYFNSFINVFTYLVVLLSVFSLFLYIKK